jgi:hypothetical protein
MNQTRKPDEETAGETVGQPVAATKHKPTGKTLQELERLQFDAAERGGFERD